ncbi:MAG: energy transducer TonB [Rhizobiales bacterium]|nr:energy transducer TonB [Hyphomicrobiales bacterium]
MGAKRYPRSARADGIEGVAQISMTINRAGRITAFRIVRSSGHQILDQEINNMISRVQPLPRMPASMPQRQISINMAIRFKLN